MGVRLRSDSRGFVFSLDASLAMLVVMLVMAGVATVNGAKFTYEQQGFLKMERIANDALEVLYSTGQMDNENYFVNTIDNIVALLNENTAENRSQAENYAENELKKILPNYLNFRMRIGSENDPRLDNVYPTLGNDNNWRAAFDNALEMASANRILYFRRDNKFDTVTLYVWREPGI